MKTDIHPNYVETTVHCSCGNEFVTRSTREKLTAELCNECHPFYTGRQKLVDAGGRVERFRKRTEKTDPSAVDAKKARREALSKLNQSTSGPSSAAKAGSSKAIRTRKTPKQIEAEAAKIERLAKAKAAMEKIASQTKEVKAPRTEAPIEVEAAADVPTEAPAQAPVTDATE